MTPAAGSLAGGTDLTLTGSGFAHLGSQMDVGVGGQRCDVTATNVDSDSGVCTTVCRVQPAEGGAAVASVTATAGVLGASSAAAPASALARDVAAGRTGLLFKQAFAAGPSFAYAEWDQDAVGPRGSAAHFNFSALTVEMWVKGPMNAKTLFQYAHNDSSYRHNGGEVALLMRNNDLRVWIKGQYMDTGVAVGGGHWVHLAVTWESATGVVKVYKDGRLEWELLTRHGMAKGKLLLAGRGGRLLLAGQYALARNTAASAQAGLAAPNATSAKMQDAGVQLQANAAFQGVLDDVRVWGRARTDDEIRLNALRSPDPADPALLAWFDFDGADAADVAANKAAASRGI